MEQIRGYLSRSKDTEPGPDGISYRGLRTVNDTRIGKAVLNDIASTVPDPITGREACPVPEEHWNIEMVMIRKPGKDWTRLNGFRPIVLANCVRKLSEKAVAEIIQCLPVFHHLTFGSRMGRAAIDVAMATHHLVRKAQIESRPQAKRGNYATLLGMDVISAFNNANQQEVLGALPAYLSPYITRFLSKRVFEVWWDQELRGGTGGTPGLTPLTDGVVRVDICHPQKGR